MRIQVDIVVAAPRELVWEILTDWERQADWMPDVLEVEILTPTRTGEGVTIRVPTRILGMVVDDVMRVTGWQPGRRLEVAHLGRVIRGRGAFELTDAPRGTTVSWWEEIDPPLGWLGESVARLLVRPLVRRVFRQSLRGLREACEVAVAR